MRESANKIKVGFDTPGNAKARAEQYAGITILSSTGGRPSRVTSSLWGLLLNFTKRYEGGVDFLYNDKGNPQRITCGVGRMSPTMTKP